MPQQQHEGAYELAHEALGHEAALVEVVPGAHPVPLVQIVLDEERVALGEAQLLAVHLPPVAHLRD